MKKIKNTRNNLKAMLAQLFTVNDSPHDISLGFGLGVFLGILPGTGPLAAIVCAQFLRVNRAAALFGALLTNTWFSLVILGLSIRIGALFIQVDKAELNHAIQAAFRPFHWNNLLQLPFSRVVLPILLGYLIISLALGIIAYIAAFLALHATRRLKKRLPHSNSLR